jgi:NAD(P)H-dependent FMN reductase
MEINMKLQIIVGSTRQGRVSDRVGKWVCNEANKLDGVEAEVVDLADYPMPFFDEAISPQYNPERTPNAEAKKWLDKVAEADAYILVTPEYNRSTTGVLKNAIDYLDYQFAKKPVGLVAHGSTGGAQAVAHLRGIIPGALGVSVPAATYFSDRAAEHIDETGNLSEELAARPYGPLMAVQNTLKDTVWYANALKTAREQA